MFIHPDSRDSAITSNLNRLRLVRYWPIGNSFFWLLSLFLGETLVGSEDLRRSICRDDTHGANWAEPFEYLRLISAVECLPGFYQPLLSHPLSLPVERLTPHQPLSLSQDSRTEKLPRTEREKTGRALDEVKTVAEQTFQIVGLSIGRGLNK